MEKCSNYQQLGESFGPAPWPSPSPTVGFAQASQRGISNIVACLLSDSEKMHLICFPLRPRKDFDEAVHWRVQHKQAETDFDYTSLHEDS